MRGKRKPYYYFLDNTGSYTTNEFFIDSSKLPWTKVLESNFELIREELSNYIASNEKELEPYFAGHMMNAPGKWKALSFFFWGVNLNKKHLQACPKTVNLLLTIPGLVSASISLLEPHAEIHPHYGDTDAIYRCHLPLLVPATLPVTGFQVGPEERSWVEGKTMVFNDAAFHKAWNRSDKQRVVLLVDVIRPEFMAQEKSICFKILTTMNVQHRLLRWPPYFRKLKMPMMAFFGFLMPIYFFLNSKKSIWYYRNK